MARGARASLPDRADFAEPPLSPPRRAQAPPPLRQKMLLQQQMRLQQGGGAGGAAVGGGGSGERPRSPFAFLGGGGSPSRERGRGRAAAVDAAGRRSSAPGLSGAKGTASGGGTADNGSSRTSGEVDPSGSDEDAARATLAATATAARDGEGRVGSVSGPQFDVLWRASQGWVLEKVMRRVELPSHMSRHRPPWEKADQRRGQGRRGGGGSAVEAAALSRSGSSPLLRSGEIVVVERSLPVHSSEGK